MTRPRERRTRPGPLAEPTQKKKKSAEPEPAPFSITLRDVEVPPPPAASEAPVDDGLILSDPQVQPEPWLGDPEADRATLRAARRAQVRKERQHAVDPPAEDQAPAPAMLVLSTGSEAIEPLRDLLQTFGFRVQMMAALPTVPAPWSFAAVFVDFAWRADGSDSIDLCNRVREASRLPGERKPALVLVAQHLSATDRVRAGLAGCNEIITGPITRGSVASALEARGVALPSDARRG